MKLWELERFGSFFILDSMEKCIYDMVCVMDVGYVLYLVLCDNVIGVMVGEYGFINIVCGFF